MKVQYPLSNMKEPIQYDLGIQYLEPWHMVIDIVKRGSVWNKLLGMCGGILGEHGQ